MNKVTNLDSAITFNHVTKPTKQSSLTAKQISITEECLKSLLSMLETSIQLSGTERSTSTSTAGAIVIPDNNEKDNQTTLAKDLWTKCGGISLGRKELQRLLRDKELSDLHINAFQNLHNSTQLVDCKVHYYNRSSYHLTIKRKETYKFYMLPSVKQSNIGLSWK